MDKEPALFSVWIEGGGKPGRWLSDWDNNLPIWRGSREQAVENAAERTRVHGRHGFAYTVLEAPAAERVRLLA